MNMYAEILDSIKWNAQGLLCVVIQDFFSRRVIMQAWMNKEALINTLETGEAHYYSRSRKKQWKKGEESGHTQHVIEMRLDCDGDALLLEVEQKEGIACHTGRESCFYRLNKNYLWVEADSVIKKESDIYVK